MAAITVVAIFLVFFLCMAIMLTWTLLVLGDHQVRIVGFLEPIQMYLVIQSHSTLYLTYIYGVQI